MLKRDSLILIIAAVSGLFSFILIVNYLKSSSGSKSQFVIASRVISKGQVIQNQDVALSKPIEQKNPSLYFLQLEDAIGNVAYSDIAQGSMFQRTQVGPAREEEASPAQEPVSLALPKGMRALTVAPKDVDNLPQTLSAGVRIDILGIAPNYEGIKELQMIVRAAQVIAVDRAGGSDIRSMTIALSPLGAIVVTKAMTQGKISLIVRSDDLDEDVVQTTLMGYTEIIRGVEKERASKYSSAKTRIET